jgi:hypothetical protein
MKRILFLLAFLPSALGAQVADTIWVQVVAPFDTVIIQTAPPVPPMNVGDTLELVAVAVDVEGDPMPMGSVVLTWGSTDPATLQVFTRPDGTGYGIALTKNTGRGTGVFVVAEPVTEMLVAALFPGDSLDWSGSFRLLREVDSTGALVGEPPTQQLCAYLVDGGWLVLESPGPPTCPAVFEPRTSDDPFRGSVFASIPRARHLAYLTPFLRLYHGQD